LLLFLRLPFAAPVKDSLKADSDLFAVCANKWISLS